MAVDYYATEAELEALVLYAFTGTTTPSSTAIQAFLEQWSATLDAIMGVAEDSYGDSDSCPQWVKQAVLHTAAMKIERVQKGEFISDKELTDYMRSFIKSRDRDYNQPSFYSATPQIGSNDSGEDWERR